MDNGRKNKDKEIHETRGTLGHKRKKYSNNIISTVTTKKMHNTRNKVTPYW